MTFFPRIIGILCVALAIGATPPKAKLEVAGAWHVHHKGGWEDLLLWQKADGTIRGRLGTRSVEGTFDSESGRIRFKRYALSAKGTNSELDAFSGVLRTERGKTQPVMAGTVTARLAQAGEWTAERFDRPDRVAELGELQGDWIVNTAEASSSRPELPEDLAIVLVGAQLSIEGNSLKWRGKLVATLGTDVSMPDFVANIGPSQRRPLVLTMPDGRVFFCAYLTSPGYVTIVYPHTMGRVGAGWWISLARP